MDRLVEKYPYKVNLYLQWYEAAIAHLLLFKYLKEKFSDHIYFLISDQGVILKATTSIHLSHAEDDLNKFFTAKIQQLEIQASPDFYDNIIEDIKEQTDKLKDTKDCPYINLVYSEKLKNSCLAMKKFGYAKPYENWQSNERQRRGFCYLIVRPEHRWREIANNVMALVKKRESSTSKVAIQPVWPFEIQYEKFVWFYLHKQFNSIKKNIEIKQKKGQSILSLIVKKQPVEFPEIEKALNNLDFLYCEKKLILPETKDKEKKSNLQRCIILSPLEIQKITELIYHEFGLRNLVRELRSKATNIYLLIGPNEEVMQYSSKETELNPKFTLRENIKKIHPSSISSIHQIGRRHSIVSYEGMNFMMVNYEIPFSSNIENTLKLRLPSLPQFYYWFLKEKQLFLLRRYESVKLKMGLQKCCLSDQVFIINSLILIMKELHKRQIFVGSKFADCIFVDHKRIMIEPCEIGSISQDISKLILVMRQWIKGLKTSELKSTLEQVNDPSEMQPILDSYIEDNSL